MLEPVTRARRRVDFEVDDLLEAARHEADGLRAVAPFVFVEQEGKGIRRDRWNYKRLDFFRYYGLKAGVNFSLGSHDEWLIYRALNALRRDKTKNPEKFTADGDVGDQIAGFFDGGQIDPASSETGVSRGYSR